MNIEPLDESESEYKYNLGAYVYYSEPPEFISSGWYTIIERIEPGLYLLSNGSYNLEASEEDLSL